MSHVSSSIALIIFMLCAACTDTAKPSRPGTDSDPKPPAVSAATCERLDTCNILLGSVEECIQEADTALSMLPQNQRAEVELAVRQCLSHPSCDGLGACLADLLEVGAFL
jgi:hypothetical protein